MEVYFLGLISYVGDATSATHGVIVLTGAQHPHYASLVIGGTSEYDIAQDQDVRISNQYASAAKLTSFTTYVPSLSFLSTTPVSLKNTVNLKSDHADATSFISYPDGNLGLTTAYLYPCGATFVRPDFRHNSVSRD